MPQPREGNDPYENNRPRNGPFARFEQAGKWSGNHRVSASARNNNHNRNSNNNNQDNESDDDELPGAYAVSRVNQGNQHSVVDDAWDPTDHIQNADVIVDPGPVTAYEEFGDEGNTSGFINTEEASVSIADDAHSVVTSPKRNDRSTRFQFLPKRLQLTNLVHRTRMTAWLTMIPSFNVSVQVRLDKRTQP